MSSSIGQDLAFALPSQGKWKDDVSRWLAEDVPSFDIGGYVVGEAEHSATLWCKQSGVLAGVPFAQEVFDQVGVKAEWKVKEGTYIKASGTDKVAVATVSGPVRKLLLAERTALNLLARSQWYCNPVPGNH